MPLNYLILIGQEHVLGALFDKVLIPEGVLEELKHPKAPEAVLVWIQTLPAWLKVARVRELDHTIQLGRGAREECLSPGGSPGRGFFFRYSGRAARRLIENVWSTIWNGRRCRC